MDYDSYDDASQIDYSEAEEDSDYGFDGGADDQPQARQVSACGCLQAPT